MPAASWNDERVEQVVGKLLQLGVSLAAFVVLVGGLLYLLKFAHAPMNYHTFRGEPDELRSFLGILRGAVQLDPRAVIQFGLLLLIATPVARVVFSVVAFALERDRTYVVITVIVLAVLCYSLF